MSKAHVRVRLMKEEHNWAIGDRADSWHAVHDLVALLYKLEIWHTWMFEIANGSYFRWVDLDDR